MQFVPNQPPPLIQQQYAPQGHQFHQNPNYNDNFNHHQPMMQNIPVIQQNYPPQNIPQNYGQNYTNNNQFIPKSEPPYQNQNFNQYQQYDRVPYQPNNNSYQQNQQNYNNQHNYRQGFPQNLQNQQQNNEQYDIRKVKNEGNRVQGKQNFNNVQRSPPKRRTFENTPIMDSPKKKKRNMEIGNLHEVTIVEMPDSTNKEVCLLNIKNTVKYITNLFCANIHTNRFK